MKTQRRLPVCLALFVLLLGLCTACNRDTPREGVRLTPEAVLPLSEELLLEKQDGYAPYCLVVTVENLGDYEVPFSGPNDISFEPEGTVSILYGGYDRIGYKTHEIVPPHGTKQVAIPFLTADPGAITGIVYDAKQSDKPKTVSLSIQMNELIGAVYSTSQ